MQSIPTLLRLDRITAFSNGSSSQTYPIRLWRYGEVSPDPTQELVVVIHGRQSNPPDRTQPLQTALPNLASLAAQIASQQNAQVLVLDWLEAAVDEGLPPFSASRRISAVADWAVEQLQFFRKLGQPIAVIGHSLGSYVGSEITRQLGTGTRLIALDPAFPGQDYDLNGLLPDQQKVSDFRVSASRSLAFAVEDDTVQTGLAGDNTQAGTADLSFLINFKGLSGLFNADEAHGAVIDAYNDLINYLDPNSAEGRQLLATFPRDRYDDLGNLDGGDHEGVVSANRVGEQWRLSQIDGDGVDWHFTRDAIASITDTDGGIDTLFSLVDVTLNSGIENLVLSGTNPLNGTGNADANQLNGNASNNLLQGDAGDDKLYGEVGNDALLGGTGNDWLIGHNDADVMAGDRGNDTLIGGTGNDRLAGGAGDDALKGNAGDDWLRGNGGTDHLMGGTGSDLFVVEVGAGQAVITDFELGRDRLGLTDGLRFANLQLVNDKSGLLVKAQRDAIAFLVGVEAAQLSRTDVVPVV